MVLLTACKHNHRHASDIEHTEAALLRISPTTIALARCPDLDAHGRTFRSLQGSQEKALFFGFLLPALLSAGAGAAGPAVAGDNIATARTSTARHC